MKKNERWADNEHWLVIVDHEWIYTGTYEQAEACAMNYWSDPDFRGECLLVSELEFFGWGTIVRED